jgi:hypothetical protein
MKILIFLMILKLLQVRCLTTMSVDEAVSAGYVEDFGIMTGE